MRYVILHESTGRLRIHFATPQMTAAQADVLESFLSGSPSVKKCSVYERTADAVVFFAPGRKKDVLACLEQADYDDEEQKALVPAYTGRLLNEEYQEKLAFPIIGYVFRKIFFPAPLEMIWTIAKSIRFIGMGIQCLLRGKLEVAVLDASAITASMLQGDFSTAGSVMLLLHIGEVLEEWTHKKSVNDLARTMSLKVDRVWMHTGDTDVLVPIGQLKTGDEIVVRTSNVIPLDGVVVSGEMTVNQSSMTGESVPVVKTQDAPVYAGTVVEEGSCIIRVTKTQGNGRYDQIVTMIEDSEKLKSATETKAFHLADKLVPWSFAGTVITYLLTRNVSRALSFLMVDFSCALKLSMPLTVLSAIREAGGHNMTVKGGKFLEAVAKADTIVFDKTGTLTHATPKVVRIECFGSWKPKQALKIAACLEEHYPHSIANAVVRKAEEEGIPHREMHTKVEYVVAHGIASTITKTGEKAVIGSYHFVFEDEKCTIPEGEKEKFEALPPEYSYLYLAVGGVLAAVICIFDPLREEAKDVMDALHVLGISKICMMTGDSFRTAQAVAKQLDIDEFHAEVLPEDKARFIKDEHKAGRTVIMVGDGINDTPALSEADVGIAVSDGAAIAREISDITISSSGQQGSSSSDALHGMNTSDRIFDTPSTGGLHELVYLRKLSMAMMRRIDRHYRFIMTYNGSLIALGAAGVLQPATSSLLHNISTVAVGTYSMTDLKV